jgi:hypothetical protein
MPSTAWHFVEQHDSFVSKLGQVLHGNADGMIEIDVDIADVLAVIGMADHTEGVPVGAETLDPPIAKLDLHEDDPVRTPFIHHARDTSGPRRRCRKDERIVGLARRQSGSGNERVLFRPQTVLRRWEE